MGRNKNMKIYLLILVLFLSGCAPIPTVTSQPSQTKVTFKEPPKLSIKEKQILTSTGYSAGIWSKDCSNKNSPTHRIYEQGDKYFTEYSEGGKSRFNGQFYDVVSVSPQVVQFKLLQTNIQSGYQDLALIKTGVSGNRRLTFDMTIIDSQGPSAGKEVVIAKDGYEVNRKSDGSFTKGSAVTPYFKCR